MPVQSLTPFTLGDFASFYSFLFIIFFLVMCRSFNERCVHRQQRSCQRTQTPPLMEISNVKLWCLSCDLSAFITRSFFRFFSTVSIFAALFDYCFISFISLSSCQRLTSLVSDWYHPVLTLCSRVAPYKETFNWVYLNRTARDERGEGPAGFSPTQIR